MLRFTTRAGFPVDATTLSSSGILFGGSVEPFSLTDAVQSTSPASSALRCRACGGYWWPGCHWRGNSNWLCGLCGDENAIDGRMPNPDELREFVMLYRDDEPAAGFTFPQYLVYFYLIDLECEEAFLDASMIAVAASLQALSQQQPETCRFGLAVSGREALTIYEFTTSAAEGGDDYIAVTTRIRNDDVGQGGKFRVDLKDATAVDAVTCGKGTMAAMIRALNCIKRLSSTTSTRYSCIGRSIETLVPFLSSVLGAHVFVFSQASASPHLSRMDAEALQRASALCAVEGGVGIDYFFVSSSSVAQVHPSLRRIVLGSGGTLFDHSYFELEQGDMMHNIRNRSSRPFIFRGMVRARTCPELSVGHVKGAANNNNATSSTSDWWLVSLLRNAALSLLTKLSFGNGQSDDSSTEQSSGTFLGKGLLSPHDGLWSISTADPGRCTVGFELDFTLPEGLHFMSYPRSMAVQIASTFVTSKGERFVRVETKSCETDRPVKSPGELWQTMDPKQCVFLLVRLLLFSGQYAPDEYKDVVLDWSRRAIASACGRERFEKKLSKPIFGLLNILTGLNQAHRFRLLGELDPLNLDKLLWPALAPCNTSAGPVLLRSAATLKLSRTTLKESKQSLVLDAVSEVFLLLKEGDDNTVARQIVANIAAKSVHHPRLFVLEVSRVLEMDGVGASPFSANKKTDEVLGKELLLNYMYEDSLSGEWQLGLESFMSAMTT